MAFLKHGAQLLQQYFQLRAGLFRPFAVDQARMAGCLAQAQQRFQYLYLRFPQTHRPDLAQQ